MTNGNHSSIRKEPVFGLKTPLLLAHRGGVLEAPESTEEGFNHALEVAACWSRTDLDYSYGQIRCDKDPPLPGEDRDADTHWFGLRQNFSIPGFFIRDLNTFFSVTLLHSTNNAAGSSYDHASSGTHGTRHGRSPFFLDIHCNAR